MGVIRSEVFKSTDWSKFAQLNGKNPLKKAEKNVQISCIYLSD